MATKAFQAYGAGHSATADTPQNAAKKFFENFPNKRKCDIVEGETDGQFFTVHYGNRFSGRGWPQSWKGITKKTVATLPNN